MTNDSILDRLQEVIVIPDGGASVVAVARFHPVGRLGELARGR